MVKYFCDCCEKEIEYDEGFRVTVENGDWEMVLEQEICKSCLDRIISVLGYTKL